MNKGLERIMPLLWNKRAVGVVTLFVILFLGCANLECYPQMSSDSSILIMQKLLELLEILERNLLLVVSM
jgi:hypothetical protein